MMSSHDDTAADVPVRDSTDPLSVLQARLQPDLPLYQNARGRQDVSRVSKEELEDRLLYLQEENVQLKEHINIQEDKIKKLGTKLMKMVKDRSRLEQLVAGRGPPGSTVRNLEMEEMVEELQDKVQTLQKQNEVLKQRHHVARQQLLSLQSRRAPPFGHVQSRVNSGLKKLRDDASCDSRPKSAWRLERGGKPAGGLLPRFGHSLLEEARAEIRSLENVNELQQNHIKETERALEVLQDEMRKKEADYEEKLLLIRQQQTSKVRSHVDNNVTLIKLQKQLADRSNTVTEMEARFLQLQESQRTLKASYDAAVAQMDKLLAQLKKEKQANLELTEQLQLSGAAKMKTQQLQEQLAEAENERDLLKESNAKLLNSAFDVSREQKWQLQEQQLRVQLAQLESALKADLVDKNEILDRIKAEQETNNKLTEDMKKLKIDCLEKQQQLEELSSRLKLYSREGEYSAAELTEALLLIKRQKAQKKMEFLTEVEEGTSSMQELKAAHAETIQELQKTRKLLNVENKICNDYKLELEQQSLKMSSDQERYQQKLEQQAQLLDARAAKISRLEAQIREIAYGAKSYTEVPGEGEADEEAVHLEHGENLLELQIVGAALSPSALELLGEHEPTTFCTYSFYEFELHSTPVVAGHAPRYGFTSRYILSTDEDFVEHARRGSVSVELHQKLAGINWRTVATSRLRLQPLLERDGKVQGTVPLVGTSEEVPAFGSLEYWFRLKLPVTETFRVFKEKVKAADGVPSALSQDTQGEDHPKEELHGWDEEEEHEAWEEERSSRDDGAASQAPLPKPRQRPHLKEVKKVTFVEPIISDEAEQAEISAGASVSAEKTQKTASPVCSPQRLWSDMASADAPISSVKQEVLSPPQSAEEEKDEESQFSEGQLLSTGCPSDDSELSEETVEDVDGVPPAKEDQSESTQSDSDDCIVQAQTTGRKPSERMRVEILSLSLLPEGRVARDSSVTRLFVEYALLDLPTEETPLSLPKPPRGKNINYNYSKVVPVDAENNGARRRLLRAVLEGRKPQMERICFTVVSEPPEEEEDGECEEVGVAFVRIPDILEQQRDLTETNLSILDLEDSSETLGTLTVTVEALEALQAVLGDQDQDQGQDQDQDQDQDQETPVTSLLH